MADLYKNNGLVFWDYLTVAPQGRLIMYPPLFHLILSGLSSLGIPLITLTRILQPVFSFILILTITYSAYLISKNVKYGVLTGLLSLTCFVTFNRSIICTPATLAFTFMILACVMFYLAFNYEKLKYVLISALSLALVANLHMATFIMTCGVLGLYGLIQLLRGKLNLKYLLVFVFLSVIMSLPWWVYVAVKYGLFFNSLAGVNLNIVEFLFKYYGIIPSILLCVGVYALIKHKSEESLFILIWAFSLMIVSQVTYLGVETVAVRILEIAAYPMIFVSSAGFMYIYDNTEKFKKLLVILLIIYATLSSLVYADSYTPDVMTPSETNQTLIPYEAHMIIDPVGKILKPSIISTRGGNTNLAHDRYMVMEWFMNNTDYKITVNEDAILDTIIVSTSKTPVIYGGFTESIPEYVVDPVHIVHNYATTNELQDLKIGYIVLNKNTNIPSYSTLVYENDHYKITRVII